MPTPAQYPQNPQEKEKYTRNTQPHIEAESVKNKDSLNPAQKAAAEAGSGPLLIVAGAGTGKTKTLTNRILNLIKRGITPERICAITFTNKAAKEMARRVGRTGPVMGTFHSLGARILRKECGAVGRDPNFAIFDSHDSFDLIKKAVKEVVPPKKKEEGAFPATRKEKASRQETPAYFAEMISKIKNLGDEKAIAGDRMASGSEETRARVLRVYATYENLLRRNNAFDFDDLIGKTVDLFKTHPEILEKYQRMFDAVLVDEYQDINPKQYEMVSLLAGAHRNLSVVGDDEQTIYSWRFADIKTFLNFDKEWEGATVHFLEQNYRSTGTIIRGAAAVAEHNRFRTPKKLWTENPDGEPIALFEGWGENDEAEWIAEKIRSLRATNRNAEVGILYRTNAQSRAIEQALIRHNIPYRIFGGLKFYERKEVKDTVAALRYIANRRDEVAKGRLEKNLTKRRFAAFAEALANEAPHDSAGSPDARNPLTPLDAIKIFLDSFHYFDYLEANYTNADEREENVTELIAFASEFTDLDELLQRLSLLEAADEIGGKGKNDDDAKKINNSNTTSQAPEVNLMTIHLAKGLEFDNIFIAGAAEGMLPHGRSIDNEASLEEERRLMYVAMTRARKKLHISFYGIPSRFIGEIPEDCITFIEEGGVGNENRGGGEGGGNGNPYRRPNNKNNSDDGWYPDEEGDEEAAIYF